MKDSIPKKPLSTYRLISLVDAANRPPCSLRRDDLKPVAVVKPLSNAEYSHQACSISEKTKTPRAKEVKNIDESLKNQALQVYHELLEAIKAQTMLTSLIVTRLTNIILVNTIKKLQVCVPLLMHYSYAHQCYVWL